MARRLIQDTAANATITAPRASYDVREFDSVILVAQHRTYVGMRPSVARIQDRYKTDSRQIQDRFKTDSRQIQDSRKQDRDSRKQDRDSRKQDK